MITVNDFALGAIDAMSISVLVGPDEYELVSSYDNKIDKRLLKIFGDYVVEDFKANKPNEYALWVMQKPVKISDL